MTADRAAAVLLLLFGVFVSVQARAVPYWTGSAPGPGFLPLWLGLLLVCASFLLAVRSRPSGDGKAEPFPYTVVLLTVGFAALTSVTGLIVASGVFMIATLSYLRPGRARSNVIAALATPAAVWLVFVRWLAVPLPAGPFGF